MISSFLYAFAMRVPSVAPDSAASVLLNALLVGALVHAVWTDVRTRRISNRLTYPLMLAGLVINGLAVGWAGLASAAVGLVIGGAVLCIPCALGVMGFGDAKLLAAIGALKGPFFVLDTMVYGGVAGGVLALLYLLRDTRVFSRLAEWAVAPGSGTDGTAVRLGTAGTVSVRKMTLPYAPAIAAGALYALFTYALH